MDGETGETYAACTDGELGGEVALVHHQRRYNLLAVSGKNAKKPAVGNVYESDARTIEEEEGDSKVLGDGDGDIKADARAKMLMYVLEHRLLTGVSSLPLIAEKGRIFPR